jgi:putative transposase
MNLPKRQRPAHGVVQPSDDLPIVFLTVCTKDRMPWLASDAVHLLLRDVWLSSNAWMVGRYVLMPDHMHLFVAPGELALPLDNWVKYWKSKFTKAHGDHEHRWQADHWDRRIRSFESYEEKWKYVCENPVRHGLVRSSDEWPYQGEILNFRWD